MEAIQRRTMAGVMILVWLLLSFMPCSAKIYKYKKNGTWHYTDTPPEDMPGDSQELQTVGRERTQQTNLP